MMTDDDEHMRGHEASPIEELKRTRPEALDFADAPDTAPLDPSYKAAMAAAEPEWLREMQRRRMQENRRLNGTE